MGHLMATVLEPAPSLPDATRPGAAETTSFLRRPRSTDGLLGMDLTIDHKKLGILYGVTAFVFFLIGGSRRCSSACSWPQPNGQILSANEYNQMFTMHGTTMIFLVIMPMSVAFLPTTWSRSRSVPGTSPSPA